MKSWLHTPTEREGREERGERERERDRLLNIVKAISLLLFQFRCNISVVTNF